MTRDAEFYTADGRGYYRPGSLSRNGGPKAIFNGLIGNCGPSDRGTTWKRNAGNNSDLEPLVCLLPLSSVSSAPTTLISDTPSVSAQAGAAAVITGIKAEQASAAALASNSSSSVAAMIAGSQSAASTIAAASSAYAAAALAAVSSSSMEAASAALAGEGTSGSATVAIVDQILSTSSLGAGAAEQQTTPSTTSTTTSSAVPPASPTPSRALYAVYQMKTVTGANPTTEYFFRVYWKDISIDTTEPDFCGKNYIWLSPLTDEIDIPPKGTQEFKFPANTVETVAEDCTWTFYSGPGSLMCSSFEESQTCTSPTTPALICPGSDSDRMIPLAKCVV